MSNKKFTESFGSGGYYIALILCAVAIGVSGYLYYRNTTSKNQTEPNQSVIATNPGGDNVQAVATGPAEGDPTAPDATEPTQIVQKPQVIRQPLEGKTIASFAMDVLSYNQTTRDWRTHNGMDIAAEAGTKVCAAADGTVYTVFQDDAMGTTVVIRHEGGYTTTYASLDSQVTVATGDTVTAGQTIGAVGTTALLETAIGEHLHFSVSCNGSYVDPAEFLAQ